MACAKQIGLIDYPIVCVNIDGYYSSFYSMLQRAHQDQFLYKHPDDILQFEPNSKKAIEFIESFLAKKNQKEEEKKTENSEEENSVVIKKFDASRREFAPRQSMLKRMMSTINSPILFESFEDEVATEKGNALFMLGMAFTAGLALGSMAQMSQRR